jgi:hypothetical protein
MFQSLGGHRIALGVDVHRLGQLLDTMDQISLLVCLELVECFLIHQHMVASCCVDFLCCNYVNNSRDRSNSIDEVIHGFYTNVVYGDNLLVRKQMILINKLLLEGLLGYDDAFER